MKGFGRPPGGVRPLLKVLVRKFRSFGGELRLRAGVKQLHTNGERVSEIELDDGQRIEADHVLSSAGSVETMRLCRTDRPPQGNGLSNLEPGGISFVETIFSLDCQPADLGHHQTIVFYSDTEQFHYECPDEACDVRSGIICSPNNFRYDSGTAPEEGRIRITALADPAYWMSRPTEDDYLAEKQRWCDRIVASALPHIPDFRSHIVDTDVFTPRTIRKFTGHDNGAVYGAPRKHVDGRTHLSNLFLCGTDQGFLGIIGSMLSGISMTNAYLLK